MIYYAVWGIAVIVSVIITVASFVFIAGVIGGIMEAIGRDDKNINQNDEDLDSFGRDLADI